ncbi:hypothetical protein L681_00235 [Stenotrophomonas maltophilia MF89]|nr:hypothetical protein L681_00235 [Stenotrophomonas maltophilia MF89]
MADKARGMSREDGFMAGQGVAIRTGSDPRMPPLLQMRICRKQG